VLSFIIFKISPCRLQLTYPLACCCYRAYKCYDWGDKKYTQYFYWSSRRLLERPRRRWNVNIEIGLSIGAENGRWMEVAKDSDPCRALLLAVMSLCAHIRENTDPNLDRNTNCLVVSHDSTLPSSECWRNRFEIGHDRFLLVPVRFKQQKSPLIYLQ
jgi:hypothetical protein